MIAVLNPERDFFMGNIRTFIALEIPETLKEKLSRFQEKILQNSRGIRWVKPENIHLTLKFLGPTNEDTVGEISGILQQITQGKTRFPFHAEGLGAFPNTTNPKVIWAGIQSDRRLFSLQKDLDKTLSSAGFPREKKSFNAHLTLGRVKDPRIKRDLRDMLDEYRHIDLGDYEFSRIVFYESDLQPSGPVYSILKAVEF